MIARNLKNKVLFIQELVRNKMIEFKQYVTILILVTLIASLLKLAVTMK